MRARQSSTRTELLPYGWPDVFLQLSLFALAYGAYEVVRGLVARGGLKPYDDATRIINLERSLHVFVEPSVQGWAEGHARWLLDVASWTYINAHFCLTFGALAFIYLRRNDSFYFVRNMFMVAMGLALIGYSVYPTAPPWLMPQWGFTDAISQVTGITTQSGSASDLLNVYAAVPSMHVCFALMIGVPIARLSQHRLAQIAWCVYPIFIVFVVIVTGNHYLFDVCLGAATAAVSALTANRLLARARPDHWAFSSAAA